MLFLLIIFFVNTHHAYAQSNFIEKGLSPEKSVPLISLTPAESAWLAEHPEIRFAFSADYPPGLIVDEDGHLSGMLKDVIDLLNQRLGSNFGITVAEIKAVREMVVNKEVAGQLALTAGNGASRGLLETHVLWETYLVIYAPKDSPMKINALEDLKGKAVSTLKGSRYAEKILAPYQDKIDIVRTDTIVEAFRLLYEGKVDYMIGLTSQAYYLTKMRFLTLEPAFVMTDRPIKVVMGVRNDWPKLVEILNKGLKSITEDEWVTINNKWLGTPDLIRPQLSLTLEEQAWIKNHPVIRLGIDQSWDPFVIVEDGVPVKGVDVEILKRINELTGCDIQLVIGKWKELVAQAKRRDIDGLTQSAATGERKEWFVFSDSYLSHYYALITTPDNKKWIDKPSDLIGKRVAIQAENLWLRKIVESIRDVQIVEATTQAGSFGLVVEGKADAACVGMGIGNKLQRDFQPTSAVIAHVFHDHRLDIVYSIRKDWPEMAGILNKALAVISDDEKAQLLKKYSLNLPEESKPAVDLTPEEQTWIAQNHKVRVRLVDFPPFMVIEEEGMSGISVDYLKLIAQRTGVNFEFIPKSNSFSESLQGLVNLQGPDLIQCMMKTPERKGKVLFTERYFSTPRVIYANAKSVDIYGMEDLSGKIISVVRDTVVYEELSKRFPMANYQILDSDLECLKAVATGKAVAYIGNLTVSEYLILDNGLSNLKIVGPSSLNDHVFSYGLRRDWPELRSIINKGLNSMTAEDKAVIRRKYLSMKYEHGIRHADVKKWVLIFGSTVLLIFFFIIFWNRSLARMVKERTSTLAESEARFRATFEQAAVGIAHVSMDGNFLRVNKKFCDIIGYSQEKTLALTFQEITHPDDLESDLVHVDQLLKGEADVYSIEKRYIRKQGESVWVHLTVSILRDDIRKPLFFVSVIKDISERKKLEENIYLYQVRLKSLASQLTLLEEKERKRIAMELHDHIGQILAFCRIQVAKAKKYAPEQGEQAAILHELSQSLLDTIQDTKDLVFDLSSPLLNELGLSAAIGQWLEEQVNKKHGLKTEFVDDGKTSLMNNDLSAILFRNVRELIANTIKHARATTIIVSMGYHGNELKLSVSDDGIGFDPDKTILPANAHFKFGLFSIKERIEDFGGSFNIVSSPGKGCQSIMIVPLLNPMA